MKKLLLSLALFCASFIYAQDNWDTLITNGVGPNKTRFNLVKVFKNKIYVAGSDSLGLTVNAYSSSSGNYGSFTNEAGLATVLQGGNEGALTAATNDNNFMFYGSGVQYDGVNNFLPQVYKFDGTSYSSFGTIPHDVTGPNRMIAGNKPFVAALALYSPTGSNDSIYAFVNPDSSHLGCTVWKSPVSNPNWVNVTKFDSASGITIVNDAIVWHKRLYIAVSGRDSGGVMLSYILSTANGSSWDTVAKNSSVLGSAGVPYYYYTGVNFYQLEIHNDTLFSAFASGYDGFPIWYTTDSLSINPVWHNLPSVGGGNCWADISDMQSAYGKLWFGVNISPCRTSGWSPRRANQLNQTADYGFDASGSTTVYCYQNGQYFSSSGGTGVSNYYSQWHDKLAFFNNALYAAGSMLHPQTNSKYGNLWRVIPPTALFTDSSSAGVNFCATNAAYLSNTSLNAINFMWTVNGTVYSHTADTMWVPGAAGTYTVTLTAYNGDPTYTNFRDSATSTITVHALPVIDTVFASYTTICQGQPDTVRAYVQPGSGPYTYGWTQSLNIIGLNDSIIPFTLTSVSTPSPSPIGFFAMDANGCQANYPYTLYITVNGGDSLSGHVVDTLSNPVKMGNVYLFKQKLNHVGVGDSSGVAPLDTNGNYYFPGLYYGDYYMKVIADTTNPLYKTSVGTYYSVRPNAYQWDSALVIQQHTCANGNNSGKNVSILQIPGAPTGPGTITGRVSKSNSFGHKFSTPNSVFGAPLKGVDIKLGKNPGGGAAARTTSDTSGNYTFTNVPIGNYKIYVDIPNFGMDSVRIVDLNINAVSVHNDYYVDSSMIRVVPIDSVSNSICTGDSILLAGAYQHNAGIYSDVIQTLRGYDSVIITTLTLKPLPTLTVTASSYTVCAGTQVTITASGASSFVWSSNAGSVPTSTVSLNPTSSDTYTVTGTNNGCSNKSTVSITVNQLPIVTLNSNSPVCENQTLNLTSSGGTIYSWIGPNTFTSSTQNPTLIGVIPAAGGVYTVTVTDANTCVNTATLSAVVNPLPVVTASGSTVCVGATINLTANGGVMYSWSGPNSFASNQQNPAMLNADASMAGSYVVTVSDMNGCVNANIAQVTVNPLPNVTANTSLNTVCLGNAITLTGGGASTYTWSGGVMDGVLFTPSATDTYTVVGLDANNCLNTATVTVTAINCVGIQNFSNGVYSVYPNPATDKLIIETTKNAHIRLVNVIGETLLEQGVSIGKNQISIVHLPQGAYELIINANGQISNQKIMITK